MKAQFTLIPAYTQFIDIYSNYAKACGGLILPDVLYYWFLM